MTPKIHQDAKHVFHLYVIQSNNRDSLKKTLNDRGVASAIHYPVSLPYLSAYSYLGHTDKDFPIAFDLPKKILSLPIYPELNNSIIEYIVKIID